MSAAQNPSQLELHPLTNLFPRMPTAEFRDFVEDIQRHGIRQPVIVHAGKIIDGRHRWEACRELGIRCPVDSYLGDASHEGLLRAVISYNLRRRHLTASQRGMLAAEALPQFEAAARERQQAAGRAHGRGQSNSSGRVRPELSGSKRARDDAAKAFEVGARSVAYAKRVRKADPELAGKVLRGEKTLRAADREVTQRQKVKVEEIGARPSDGRLRLLTRALRMVREAQLIEPKTEETVRCLAELEELVCKALDAVLATRSGC